MLHAHAATVRAGSLRVGDTLSLTAHITDAQSDSDFFKLVAHAITVGSNPQTVSLTQLQKLVTETRAELATLSGRVTDLTTYVHQHFAAIDSDLAALHASTDQLGGALALLESRTSAIKTDLANTKAALQQRIDALQSSTDTQLDGLKTRLTDATRRISTVETDISGAVAAIA